eukprot:EG_transcript_27350
MQPAGLAAEGAALYAAHPPAPGRTAADALQRFGPADPPYPSSSPRPPPNSTAMFGEPLPNNLTPEMSQHAAASMMANYHAAAHNWTTAAQQQQLQQQQFFGGVGLPVPSASPAPVPAAWTPSSYPYASSSYPTVPGPLPSPSGPMYLPPQYQAQYLSNALAMRSLAQWPVPLGYPPAPGTPQGSGTSPTAATALAAAGPLSPPAITPTR